MPIAHLTLLTATLLTANLPALDIEKQHGLSLEGASTWRSALRNLGIKQQINTGFVPGHMLWHVGHLV